jgi:hypothetical protein
VPPRLQGATHRAQVRGHAACVIESVVRNNDSHVSLR